MRLQLGQNDRITNPRRLDNAAGVVLMGAFLYVCLRAARLSITHDEALTYLIHVHGTFSQILSHSLRFNSNNHLLNTLLIKPLVGAFGADEHIHGSGITS